MGRGGIKWKEVKSEKHVIQHNPALILHHTSFCFFQLAAEEML